MGSDSQGRGNEKVKVKRKYGVKGPSMREREKGEAGKCRVRYEKRRIFQL